MPRKLTTAEFLEKAKTKANPSLDLSLVEYSASLIPVDVRCNKHGLMFTMKPNKILTGQNGCPDCSGKRLTTDDFIRRAQTAHQKRMFDYSVTEYVNMQTKVKIICNEHEHKFEQLPQAHLNGFNGCYECNGQKKITPDVFISRAQESFENKKFDYSKLPERFESIHMQVQIRCVEHDEWFKQSAWSHLNSMIGCQKCLLATQLMTVEEFTKKSKEVHGEHRYKGYNKLFFEHGLKGDLVLECPKHGEFSYYSMIEHLQGKEGCVPCRRVGTSKAEQSLYDYVRNLLPECEIQRGNRKLLSGKELDIYIPEKHFAIEYNGVYWHSERFGKDKWYHYRKWLECKQQGIQLLTIWEDDYARKPELIRRMIAHKLGVSSVYKVPARKTVFKRVGREEASVFLERNHLQGAHKTSRHYGLRDSVDNEFIAVMSTRYSVSKQELEISRFATSMTVQGGFTKLLTNVLRQPEFSGVDKVVSYSHNDHSDGTLYEQNGFGLVHSGTPGYFYLRPGQVEREHRLNYSPKRFRERADLLHEQGLTERELASLNGLERIWDCGSTRWEKTLTDHQVVYCSKGVC